MGYEARVYTATESQGEVELSISVTEPPTGGALRPFTLTMNMEDGTARMLTLSQLRTHLCVRGLHKPIRIYMWV